MKIKPMKSTIMISMTWKITEDIVSAGIGSATDTVI
jgi:hypothetical protein